MDETTRYQKIRMQQGVEFEHAWIQEHYPDAMKIEPAFGFEALKNTLVFIMAGVTFLSQTIFLYF